MLALLALEVGARSKAKSVELTAQDDSA